MSSLANDDWKNILYCIYKINEQLDNDSIYDVILRSIKTVFNAKAVSFSPSDFSNQWIDHMKVAGTGIIEDNKNEYIKYYHRYNPLLRNKEHNLRTIYRINDIIPAEQWVEEKIYKQFWKPQDIHFSMYIRLQQKKTLLGEIGLFRSAGQSDFVLNDIVKASLLAPYLTTSLITSYKLMQAVNKGSETNNNTIKHKSLTDREIEIAGLVCSGLTNKEIANKLSLSTFTIDTHLKNIFDKTGIRHRSGLSTILLKKQFFADES
jgi:DNA-binding CsgD family transcriptional regulator